MRLSGPQSRRRSAGDAWPVPRHVGGVDGGVAPDPTRIISVGLGTLNTNHAEFALRIPFTPITRTGRVGSRRVPMRTGVVITLPAFGWPAGITSMFEIGAPWPQNCM